jgi:superfamily II DNA or RNA helicase
VLDSTPRDVRRGVRARLLSGETRHVVTCKALVKGFDAPVLDCAVLTSQGTVTSYLQSVGRVLRPFEGERALVIDRRQRRHGVRARRLRRRARFAASAVGGAGRRDAGERSDPGDVADRTAVERAVVSVMRPCRSTVRRSLWLAVQHGATHRQV